MRLRISWTSIRSLWDGLFEAGDGGIARAIRRRKARQFRTPPKRKRSYIPWGEGLERRELPAALSGMTEYAITTANSGAMGICAGPDGNTWFVESSVNKIAKITPSGTITEYTIPTANSGPYDIVAGPDGLLWFTEAGASKIGKVTTSGTFTEYSLAGAYLPHGITLGPDGLLWFTESGNSAIAKITTSGTITEYSTPTSLSSPEDILAGPDGSLWFTEFTLTANKIGKSTTSGSITEYTIPTMMAGPFGVAADSSVWFTESTANKIGRLTVAGNFTEYTIPTGSSSPQGITIGPDANIWFVERSTDKIGRMTPFGEFTETTVPTAGALLEQIAIGGDGNLWMTASGTNKIIKYGWIQQTQVPANDPSQCHQSTFSIAGLPAGTTAENVYGPTAAPRFAPVGSFGASPQTGAVEFKIPVDGSGDTEAAIGDDIGIIGGGMEGG